MPGCHVGWLARLAGWLAGMAGMAGWVQLAGCCWLAAASKEVPHARRSSMSADLEGKNEAGNNKYM